MEIALNTPPPPCDRGGIKRACHEACGSDISVSGKRAYITRARKGSVRTYVCVKHEDSLTLWAECSEKQHAQHEKVIVAVANAIQMGHVNSKDAARKLTNRLMQTIA